MEIQKCTNRVKSTFHSRIKFGSMFLNILHQNSEHYNVIQYICINVFFMRTAYTYVVRISCTRSDKYQEPLLSPLSPIHWLCIPLRNNEKMPLLQSLSVLFRGFEKALTKCSDVWRLCLLGQTMSSMEKSMTILHFISASALQAKIKRITQVHQCINWWYTIHVPTVSPLSQCVMSFEAISSGTAKTL